MQFIDFKPIFPVRWTKVPNEMLEKGKVPVLGKLRAIKSIEAYFQMLMREFSNERMAGKIENDKRASKGNYSSRKVHSIDDSILEKRLLHDCSAQNIQPKMRNLTDLQSCYGRELVIFFGAAEEVAGSERWDMQLFTKLMQRLEHHVDPRHGISEEFCGRYFDLMGGLGQGPMYKVQIAGTNLVSNSKTGEMRDFLDAT